MEVILIIFKKGFQNISFSKYKNNINKIFSQIFPITTKKILLFGQLKLEIPNTLLGMVFKTMFGLLVLLSHIYK